MNLQSGKSPGPDSWPVQIIKPVDKFIAIPLFNDVLPQDWKSAHVMPILKGILFQTIIQFYFLQVDDQRSH